MTRRTKIRTAHVTAATVAIVASDALTSYAATQSHHTDSGAWTGWQILGWLLLCLSGLWVLLLGWDSLAGLRQTLWAARSVPQCRPAPGTGGRESSLKRREWRQLDREYAAYRRSVRIADLLAHPDAPRDADDTQLMLVADILEMDGSLIDALERHGVAPDRTVHAPEAPATVWTVEPAGLPGQGATLHAWFGDAFERAA